MEARKSSPVHNRVEAVMSHSNWYLIDGVSRLAADTGYAKSTVYRLLRGQLSPSFALAWAVTDALSKRLRTRLEIQDLFSVDGRYRKASFCKAAGCPGCFLERAFTDRKWESPPKPPSEDRLSHAIPAVNHLEAS